MRRDFPCDAPRLCAGPWRSIPSTDQPRRAHCAATALPIAPRPTTTTSYTTRGVSQRHRRTPAGRVITPVNPYRARGPRFVRVWIALVVQRIRMPRFERGGRGFDSLRGRQNHEPSMDTIFSVCSIGCRCVEYGADIYRFDAAKRIRRAGDPVRASAVPERCAEQWPPKHGIEPPEVRAADGGAPVPVESASDGPDARQPGPRIHRAADRRKGAGEACE